jgi:hypothetical protein
MFGGNLSRPCTMFVLQICYQIFVICRVHAPYGGKSYSSYTYLVLASFLILSVCREPMAAIEKRVTEALAEYEARHEFARLVTLPRRGSREVHAAGEMGRRLSLVSC